MSSLHYLLSKSPNRVAAAYMDKTVREVSRELPEAVGFTRMPSGLWEGPQVIREASPNGNLRAYDPNYAGGNFADFQSYDRATGAYLAANLPQTRTAGTEFGLSIIQYGTLGNITMIDLWDTESTQPYRRRIEVAASMQTLVRSVLEWYDVRL